MSFGKFCGIEINPAEVDHVPLVEGIAEIQSDMGLLGSLRLILIIGCSLVLVDLNLYWAE